MVILAVIFMDVFVVVFMVVFVAVFVAAQSYFLSLGIMGVSQIYQLFILCLWDVLGVSERVF